MADGASTRDEAAAGDDLGGLAQLVAAREEKAARLRAAGFDPYPARAERTHLAEDAAAEFEVLEAGGEEEGPEGVVLAGRLVGGVRGMGGSAFVHLRDRSGEVQLHLRRNRMGEVAFDRFKADFDSGDLVQARGGMFRTRKGEVSLAVDEIAMLAKSLLPSSAKWEGDRLQDIETRFRKRYLDLLNSDETRERFVARARVLRAMRDYLDARGFMEVETPVLQPIYGGGAAQPFTTHYNALDQRMYLRIADELYMKRLIVGGFDRVYEIAKDFRNEGIDRTHLPEFTQMECYWAYADYTDMMELTEEMVAHIAREINGSTETVVDGSPIDLAPPWRRLTVRDAILESAGIDIDEHRTLDELRAAIDAAGIEADPQPTWAKTVDELLSETVEPTLQQPTFLMDYPVELSPLAKRKPGLPDYVERFEPFAGGFELGNAFTELNDPQDQRARFAEMARDRAAGDAEAHPVDEDFLEALMHGMPPTAGLGIGVDRLVMLLTGTGNIREVVLFPQLRTPR
ncbi:MAG: lysine--tRNA ligase [Anaerolineae bacterium]